MKVLVVGPDRGDPGGVANFYNAVFPRLANATVDAHYLEIGSTKGGGGLLHALTDQLRFWKAIGSYKPDLVHLNPSLDMKSYLRDGLFIFLAKLRRRRVLVFFRGWQKPFEARIKGLLKLFFSLTYQRADAFVVLAEEFGNSLKNWGITAPIALGTTTVDDNLLTHFSIDTKINEIHNAETIRLLYLARLERGKGVLSLVDAVGSLLEKGLNISLTIAGTGPIEGELEGKIKALGVHGESIALAGYVRGDDKCDTFSSHHIFCFPTQYGEGMPNAVLEAMAFGMPIVTCPVGGIADFFENGKMGTLLSSQDAEEISTAIATLVENQPGLATTAQYNYSYARDRFLASTVAGFLRSQYAEAASPSQE